MLAPYFKTSGYDFRALSREASSPEVNQVLIDVFAPSYIELIKVVADCRSLMNTHPIRKHLPSNYSINVVRTYARALDGCVDFRCSTTTPDSYIWEYISDDVRKLWVAKLEPIAISKWLTEIAGTRLEAQVLPLLPNLAWRAALRCAKPL